MLRSGVNGLHTQGCRPCGWSSRSHWTASRDGEDVEFAAANFADAFLSLPLLEHERKYAVVKMVSSWCFPQRRVWARTRSTFVERASRGRRKTHLSNVLTVESTTAVLRG